MSARPRVSGPEYSRRLPPPEAWKHPDKWLDLTTGLVKKDSPRLVVPSDDRGLVEPDEIVDAVNDAFFWSDYDWPFNPGDPETAPDDHHFYFTARSYSLEENDGTATAARFRELPVHIGWMPRQFHNAIHDLTRPPEKPSLEVMEAYFDSYQLAYQAFRRLIGTAHQTTVSSNKIGQRRQTIQAGRVLPRDPDDRISLESLRTAFTKNFKAYSTSVNAWRELPSEQTALLQVPELRAYKPHLVARKFGRVAVSRHRNYVPVLQGSGGR